MSESDKRPADVLLTAGDFRGAFCMAGVRRAFLESGADYARLLDSGIPASELYGRGYDAMIDRVVAQKIGTGQD